MTDRQLGVQLAICWRAHVNLHMRGSTVQNQNKNNSAKSETNTEWSKSRWWGVIGNLDFQWYFLPSTLPRVRNSMHLSYLGALVVLIIHAVPWQLQWAVGTLRPCTGSTWWASPGCSGSTPSQWLPCRLDICLGSRSTQSSCLDSFESYFLIFGP